MSKYTTEVRFICESEAGLLKSEGFDSVDDILDASWDKIFTTQCEFFDEDYRPIICKKILKHYYTREIGAETVGLWKLWMNRCLEEQMPYFNLLYKSALLDFDPFQDTDYSTTHEKTNEGNVNGNTSGTESWSGSDVTNKEGTDSKTETTTLQETDNDVSQSTQNMDRENLHWNLYSDTPQGGVDGMEALESNLYLTNATKDTDSTQQTTTTNATDDLTKNATQNKQTDDTWAETDTTTYGKNIDSTGTSEQKSNSTENYVEHVAGKRGTLTYSEMVLKLRETFLNIDLMLIDKFKDNFFGLW